MLKACLSLVSPLEQSPEKETGVCGGVGSRKLHEAADLKSLRWLMRFCSMDKERTYWRQHMSRIQARVQSLGIMVSQVLTAYVVALDHDWLYPKSRNIQKQETDKVSSSKSSFGILNSLLADYRPASPVDLDVELW